MGAPDYKCLLALIYMWFLLNHTYNSDINYIPISNKTGSTADIIRLLNFRFWQTSIYKVDESNLFSDSTKNVADGLVSQNILYMLLHLRFLMMSLIRFS